MSAPQLWVLDIDMELHSRLRGDYSINWQGEYVGKFSIEARSEMKWFDAAFLSDVVYSSQFPFAQLKNVVLQDRGKAYMQKVIAAISSRSTKQPEQISIGGMTMLESKVNGHSVSLIYTPGRNLTIAVKK